MGTRRKNQKKRAATRKKPKTKKPSMHHVHGYTVLLLSLPTDNVYVSSIVNNGFISETKSTAGINHLLEHMIANGWPGCGKDPCTVFWSKEGVKSNASTDMTVLKYFTYGRKEDTPVMLEYIIDIVTKPVFTAGSLKRQKRAVLNELLTYSNNPESLLTDAFNKAFYSIDGLKYSADYALQRQNLGSMTLSKLRKAFRENYRRSNMIFSVTGNFNEKEVLAEFERILSGTARDGASVSPCRSCYSRLHRIMYVPSKTAKTTKILIGFPSTVRMQDKGFPLVTLGVTILGQIAFEVLRGDKKLVYGVSMKAMTHSCGTTMLVSVYVDDENALEVIVELFKILKKYKDTLVPKKYLSAVKKKSLMEYGDTMATPLLIGDMYAGQYIAQQGLTNPRITSLSQYKNDVLTATREDIRRMLRRILLFKDCLCAYQGRKKLEVDWSDIL